jgi:hypothetical protein
MRHPFGLGRHCRAGPTSNQDKHPNPAATLPLNPSEFQVVMAIAHHSYRYVGDLLPWDPAAAMRVLVVHSGSGAAMVAGARRSWSGLRSRAPADRRCAAWGVRPRWTECGRT